MAIQELSEEQVRTWTLEEKDRWWRTHVFRGDMPQLTWRSALTGMALGSVLALTNLYVGAKTGWTLGVGITSVILAFALFKVLSTLGMANEFSVLENNAMQSIATAAGYMTSPMISSLAALMLIQDRVVPAWQTMLWITLLAILGVLFAFPFKRRFINDEQQPFPEGRAAGVVMDSLHHGEAAAGMVKAKLLVFFSSLAAIVKLFQSEAITRAVGIVWHIPEYLDEWLYRLIDHTPKILGTPVTQLTLRPELDLPMIGAGGLMGIRTGLSLLIGATVNYAILAPIFIQAGDIRPTAQGAINFRQITYWSLWCGVGMMTVASLLAFFAKPDIVIGAFKKLRGGSRESNDVLGDVELPLSVSLIGIPIVGALVVWMAHDFFGVHPLYGVLAIVLVFFFCLIAINSTGLTSITPIGAMGKLTQLTFGVVAPGDKAVNLVTAGITGEVASSAANLLQDIKPGYMLGAKPRQQAVGHVLGAIAGSFLSVPVFYLVFLQAGNTHLDPAQALAVRAPDVHDLNFGEFPMPAATVWKGVADVLAEGLSSIPKSAQWTALIGILIAIVLEVLRLRTKGAFPLSPVGIGLGFVIPFPNCLSMFLGSFFFWLVDRGSRRPGSFQRLIVDNQEPICAGLIAGGALMGIVVAVVEVFFLAG